MSVSTVNVAFDYNVSLKEDLSALIAEFFRVPKSEVLARIDKELKEEDGGLVAQAWQQANPQTTNEVLSFYQQTDSYVYELAADHCRSRRLPVWEAMLQRIKQRGGEQRILIFGDGIGTDSIMLAKRGHQVTYFDLPGITANFARFRFVREGVDKHIMIAERVEDIAQNTFDVVICIEVLEHLTNPMETLHQFYRLLKPNGIALITESFEYIGPDYPSHLPSNFQYAGRTHWLMEQLGFANTYYNLDPINRPMEFTKTIPTFSGWLLKLQGRMRRVIDTRWRRVNSLLGGKSKT